MQKREGKNRQITESQADMDPVISYVIKFLNSKSAGLMNYCYSSIRDRFSQRCFQSTIEEIEDISFDALFPLITNVILTANKIECDSLNYIASMQKGNDLMKRKHLLPIFKGNDLHAAEAYIFKIHSAYILHLNSSDTGSNTPGGSSDLVRFISNHQFLSPFAIISFGICYGRDPKKQKFGDVIIPKKLYPWSIGQKITEEGFTIKNDNFNLWLEEKFSESGVYSCIRNFCNGDDGTILTHYIKPENTSKKYEFQIKVSLGNMSTGEAVISSSHAKELIRDASKNDAELGGEMEGYGLAKECIYYAKIPCFIVKAICDWGERKNIENELDRIRITHPLKLKDRLQAYAAFCAGIALINLLDQEKENLLSLKLINWMATKKGNHINKYSYLKKDKTIGLIKEFYETSSEIAEKIFDTLLESSIICENVDGVYYRTTFEIQTSGKKSIGN